MCAEIGDRRAHRCARRAADGQRRADADDECEDARLRSAIHVEDPGQGQAAEVRGGDDRQIDSAGHDRREHRQGEQTQIGQLKARSNSKFAALRNCGDVRPKATTVSTSSPRSPGTSRPNTRPRRSVTIDMTTPPRPARQDRDQINIRE